jgi:hypothetical protein
MRDIVELNVLLRVRAEMPEGLTLATDGFREGWNRLRTRNAIGLERKLKACRWHFIRDKRVMASGTGQTPQQAIACALDHALAEVSPELNAIEVGEIQSTQYPWFWLARVSIHAFRIQKSEELAAQDRAVLAHNSDAKPILQVHSADLKHDFAKTLPLMEQRLRRSPRVQSGAQR